MRRKLLSLILTAAMVLSLIPGFTVGVQAKEITDTLTRELTGVKSGSTSYTSWTGKQSQSDAVYAGQSAGDKDSIQLRSKNSNSGIVTTVSGGLAISVSIDFESSTVSGRKIDVYGKSTAYTDPTELYNAETAGTLIGSIECGAESTTLSIDDDYEFIGLRSNNGAAYLSSVTIVWDDGSGAGTHVHDFGEWTSNNDGTHSRICSAANCTLQGGKETANCQFGTPVTTPATCTTAGTEVKTCTVCGYVSTETIPATGIHTDENKDGKCDSCGADMPKPFTLTTAIHDGDQIVIVYAATSMALTTTASGSKLQGVAVEPDGNDLTVNKPEIAVLTVDLNDDGTFVLTNADGKYLTSGATGNGVSFTDEANDYSLWKMNESYDGSANHTVVIDNVNAKYNNNSQSLEYYSGFTTYGTKLTAAYQMKIYAISEEVSHVLSYVSNNNGTHNVVCSVVGCTENHNAENVDCEYEYTVVEPTYTETGYTTATCKYCGYSYRTNEVPVLDPVTLYPADSLEGATKVALYLPMTDNNDGFTGLLLSSDLASTQKYYLAAVQVNADGSIVNPDAAAVWNVAKTNEGKYSFTSGSKTLDSYISGTHYNICTNELDSYPESALWTLTAAEGGFTIVSGADVYLAYQWYASGSKHEFQGSSEGTFAFKLFTDAKKDAEISGYNLTLGNVIDPDGDGDLQVNFYVENVEESAIGDYYMTFKDGDGNVLLANAPLANVTGKGIRASLPVAMKDYDKKIVGTLFDKDGNELDSAALDNGVKTYIENAPQSVSNIVTALDSLCDFTKELLLDGYTSTKAAPADHTADLATYAPTVSGEGQNASVYGISLLMKDKVALRAYIRQNSEVIAELDQLTVTGEATTSSTVFYYEIKGFTRLTLGTPHKLTVNCGQDAVSISNFSPLSYANIVVNDQNSDESLVKFANALYEYFAAVD